MTSSAWIGACTAWRRLLAGVFSLVSLADLRAAVSRPRLVACGRPVLGCLAVSLASSWRTACRSHSGWGRCSGRQVLPRHARRHGALPVGHRVQLAIALGAACCMPSFRRAGPRGRRRPAPRSTPHASHHGDAMRDGLRLFDGSMLVPGGETGEGPWAFLGTGHHGFMFIDGDGSCAALRHRSSPSWPAARSRPLPPSPGLARYHADASPSRCPHHLPRWSPSFVQGMMGDMLGPKEDAKTLACRFVGTLFLYILVCNLMSHGARACSPPPTTSTRTSAWP